MKIEFMVSVSGAPKPQRQTKQTEWLFDERYPVQYADEWHSYGAVAFRWTIARSDWMKYEDPYPCARHSCSSLFAPSSWSSSFASTFRWYPFGNAGIYLIASMVCVAKQFVYFISTEIVIIASPVRCVHSNSFVDQMPRSKWIRYQTMQRHHVCILKNPKPMTRACHGVRRQESTERSAHGCQCWLWAKWISEWNGNLKIRLESANEPYSCSFRRRLGTFNRRTLNIFIMNKWFEKSLCATTGQPYHHINFI